MKSILLNLFFTLMLLFGVSAHSFTQNYIRGFNIVEVGQFLFDANETTKTPAQLAVDKAKALGANHIIINLKATMRGPYSNEIIPNTAPADRNSERQRIARLVKYIKSQGMTVGMRPIFFVVGPNGEFPYNEKLADGTVKSWWHGNIQPRDPNRWFESFKIYLDLYLPIASILKVEEFTLGAELYSMTVGIEDQWKEFPYGFPGRWLQLLRYVRSKLPQSRLMYDINFTDDKISQDGFGATGGELERWRYRLVDLADPVDPAQKQIWNDLKSFWSELDAIGIDVYRSLASRNETIPTQYADLLNLLKERTDSFATQIDNIASQVSLTLGVDKPLIFKELGFRSVEKGFIDPFAYAGSGQVNIQHQAAAIEAYFASFWVVNFNWFSGFNFWEISLDPSREGQLDVGFSPIGKSQTESVIMRYYKNNF